MMAGGSDSASVDMKAVIVSQLYEKEGFDVHDDENKEELVNHR